MREVKSHALRHTESEWETLGSNPVNSAFLVYFLVYFRTRYVLNPQLDCKSLKNKGSLFSLQKFADNK